MTNSNAFASFARGEAKKTRSSNINCVIYTRVSSKEQAMTNFSLETQMDRCTEYAQRKGYKILDFFGGTYESAKTDERNEFDRMLRFAKRSKQQVDIIVVWKFDRFSRTGPSAIYISGELLKKGIGVESVTQPTEPFSASGQLQQTIYLAFSQYDNATRTENMITGRKKSLQRGNWVSNPPYGYEKTIINGETKLVPNEIGKKLKQAFQWKGKEGLSNTAIVKRLQAMGLEDIYMQKLSKIFRNPFYCGMIVHKSLNGEVVEGKQEKIVSKKLFLKINEILSKSPKSGREHTNEFEETPLKHFMRCQCCGKYMTAYVRTKKSKRLKTDGSKVVYNYSKPYFYYKCPTTGCKLNLSAPKTNSLFLQELDKIKLAEDLKLVAEKQLWATFHEMNQSVSTRHKTLERELKKVEAKIKDAKRACFKREISQEIFDEFMPELEAERLKCLQEIANASKTISNPQDYIDRSIHIGANLPLLYDEGQLHDKSKLQKLVFPDELFYDRTITNFRTPRLGGIFTLFQAFQPAEAEKRKRDQSLVVDRSLDAGSKGFEPLFNNDLEISCRR